ncbi:IPT/TIG domain-containing protein [Segetibacter sp.]|jgi:hypothetical protein|uniref:IPT/TIG domain-containing protein n=1 Tax=Segetibacter sp. TaxID=2231182 RepID=UPI002621BC6A|nr:IPT/TIG domain-containing protein [Segetibacter sp.]MCW3080107.1 hypothetical protein [Segetibacter sp.]
MNRIFNKSLLSLIWVVMLIGLLTACKKDSNVNSGKVELMSFGPTGAKPGDTLRFIGNNLNQVTAIDLTGASVPSSAFIQMTPELISLIVPQQTQQGYVTLRTPQGDIVSKTRLNLMVPVTIASITKEARPGGNVTITGRYMNWVTRVTFAKNKVADTTAFVSKSLTELVVRVPADAQTGPVVLSYGGTEPKDIESADTVKVTLPVSTAFSPTPVKHQTNLTITGTNLDLVKQVVFTGVTTPVTTFVSQSATQVVVKVPASTQKGKVSLLAASGVATVSTTDLDVVLPSITSMSPNPVNPEGNVTITGTDLDLVTGVKFTGVATAVTSFVSQSPTSVVVKAPAGAIKGKLTLSILNSTLTVSTADDIKFVGASDLTPFKVVVFEEALDSNWEKWGGWGTSVQDMANTEQALSGTKAIKITWTDAYGGFQLHPKSSFPLSSYTAIRVSIYGGAGTVTGSKVTMFIKSAAGVQSPNKELVLKAGEYTTYEIPLSQLGNPTDISELNFQNAGTPTITIYVDDYGLF